MFARRPSTPAAAGAPSSAAVTSSELMALLSNPYLGAGGAGLMMLAAVCALVLVAGDPHAGAPSLRIPLDTGAHTTPLDRPNTLGPSGVALDTLSPGQQVTFPGPTTDQAIITLPQGATMAGAAPVAQGAAVGADPAPIVQTLGPPLTPAPIAGLTAPGPGGGLLPVIAKGGRTPFQAYARPFHDEGKPKVALVIGGLGLNAAATKAAIERLPPEVTLSFVPYADGLQQWVDMARAAGHEVVLEIPMEPLDYPSNDPGPYTLMANGAPAETARRLDWLLSRTTGYFGVANYLGGRFVSAPAAMTAFANALQRRGLAFVDDGSAAGRAQGVPRASASAVIDEQLSANDIDKQLQALEAQAQAHGSALGSGFSYPVTVDQVARWAQGLAARGYQLAPASAITHR